MTWFRRLLIGAILFALGVLAGPFLVGVVAGFAASSDEPSRQSNAYELLSAFDERYPAPISLPYIDWQAAAGDCGHDFETVFGSATPPLTGGSAWTPFTGYFDLLAAERREVRERLESVRARQLAEHLKAFEIAFLTTCLRSALLPGACGVRVRTVLAHRDLVDPYRWPSRGPRPNLTRQRTTLCTYLDGLAARRRQPRSTRAR
jgi:hypothetical protein